ncbi:hypothetical protein CW304_16145 [Bacillus sp. UFRGS-B20]|nr:hypothetical protein CW304_16145 [Bacillus sp. UFRGS-B20]
MISVPAPQIFQNTSHQTCYNTAFFSSIHGNISYPTDLAFYLELTNLTHWHVGIRGVFVIFG